MVKKVILKNPLFHRQIKHSFQWTIISLGESVRFFKKSLRSVLAGVIDMFSQPLSVPPPVSDAHPFQDSLHYRLQNDEQHDDEYHGHDILHSS